MPKHSSPSDADRDAKQFSASSMAREALRPMPMVETICDELQYAFRKTVYRPMIAVWMFIHQVIAHDDDCETSVTRLNAYRASIGQPPVSPDSGAYCKARSKLPEKLFERLLAWTASRCETVTDETWLWCGRVVEMVDGWTVTMADTPENQAEYPQMKSQKKGCGFPIARMVGLFSLATGSVIQVAAGPYRGKETGETALLRGLLGNVKKDRILLADRFYASFWLLAMGERVGIDLVARAHHLRVIDFRKGIKLGTLDQLVLYRRPDQRPKWMSRREYKAFPQWIFVRHLRYQVEQKGFRTRTVTLATTLIDSQKYGAEELAKLYGKRWGVELHIRSIKTHMKMEHLKCKSPSMVRKEIHAHLIGYNLIRSTMTASALKFEIDPIRLSFERSRGELSEYAAGVRSGSVDADGSRWESMLWAVSQHTVGHRPGRKEPRELKRRPKQYKFMTKPRDPNRNRYATAA